jgi:hypothetical protein
VCKRMYVAPVAVRIQIYRRTLGWDSPDCRAISRERLSFHSCNYGFSSTGVRTVRRRPAFKSAAGITLPVSRRRCYNIRNTLASGDVDQDNVARITVPQ